ncbi:hypothetical protein PINS_up008159 [Pythium insidiosum]|nr:hypothetical protein PINS_up008159 [Pythium insidiosum]
MGHSKSPSTVSKGNCDVLSNGSVSTLDDTRSTASTTNNSSSNNNNQLFGHMSSSQGRDLIDRLREIGLDQYIELPQIAVMGDTSSGKSSLLSALSGVTFPSSDQLTTRCPAQLILSSGPFFRGNVRLHRFHANESEFHEDIASMTDVPHAIQKLTQVLVDEGQYISDDQIVLELSGPDLPNVTLTDLPGLVRTVGDHEDKAIIGRVRDMVNRFMTQERTIIIAVVPANVDMHNTEILQAAQEADPSGMRTIAVITKMDLVDAGAETAVHDLLLNKKKHMQLGYHAVKCRSQKDLNDGATISDGLRREEQFFKNHEYWRRLPPNLWGVSRLSARLTTILQDNIRRTLPTVVKEIGELMDKTSAELQALGMPTDTPGARRQAFFPVGADVHPLHEGCCGWRVRDAAETTRRWRRRGRRFETSSGLAEARDAVHGGAGEDEGGDSWCRVHQESKRRPCGRRRRGAGWKQVAACVRYAHEWQRRFPWRMDRTAALALCQVCKGRVSRLPSLSSRIEATSWQSSRPIASSAISSVGGWINGRTH